MKQTSRARSIALTGRATGATENAGVEKSARSKMQWCKMQEKHWHGPAGVENAGVEISGRLGHNPTGVENAGVN